MTSRLPCRTGWQPVPVRGRIANPSYVRLWKSSLGRSMAKLDRLGVSGRAFLEGQRVTAASANSVGNPPAQVGILQSVDTLRLPAQDFAPNREGFSSLAQID